MTTFLKIVWIDDGVVSHMTKATESRQLFKAVAKKTLCQMLKQQNPSNLKHYHVKSQKVGKILLSLRRIKRIYKAFNFL